MDPSDHSLWVDVAKPTLEKCRALRAHVDDESEPYKSKYEAAEVLQDVITSTCSQLKNSNADFDPDNSWVLAALTCYRGACLLDTDLTSEGEKAVLQGLSQLEEVAKQSGICTDICLECSNSLGLLFCSRDDAVKAHNYLLQAVSLYEHWKASIFGNTEETVCSRDSANGQQHKSDTDERDRIESEHTLTLFYMAQSYRLQHDDVKAADYCAATLARQLQPEPQDPTDWLQNCVQLSGFYLGVNNYAAAKYCLLAADAIAKRHSGAIDADVAANLALGWGKWSANLLHYSAQHRSHKTDHSDDDDGDDSDDKDADADDVACSSLPEQLRFDGPGMPSVSDVADVAMVRDFEGAKGVFSKGLQGLQGALQHYQLDGWVTDHVHILMDISLLYRSLAAFEADAHRRCVMHRARAKLFERLVCDGALNAAAYCGLLRSMTLECGNAFRDIADVKSASSWPPAKVAEAARKALGHYRTFLGTFRGSNGALPATIDDDDAACAVMTACCNAARAVNKMQTRDASTLAEACSLCNYVVEYVQGHSMHAFAQHAELCGELERLFLGKLQQLQHA